LGSTTGAYVFNTGSNQAVEFFTFTVQANLVVTYQTDFHKRSTVSEKLAVTKEVVMSNRPNVASIFEAATAAAPGVVSPFPVMAMTAAAAVVVVGLF